MVLTKCPGVGERGSLRPADPGTSRRGHFICRYCVGGEREKWRRQHENEPETAARERRNARYVYIHESFRKREHHKTTTRSSDLTFTKTVRKKN